MRHIHPSTAARLSSLKMLKKIKKKSMRILGQFTPARRAGRTAENFPTVLDPSGPLWRRRGARTASPQPTADLGASPPPVGAANPRALQTAVAQEANN